MKTLITYFSAQGRTKNIAEAVAKECDVDVFEIIPVEPYTEADIKWTNPLARCNREMIGKKDVPVAGKIENFEEYDKILIGFPIWYGCAPNVVNTFCDGYDFSGKTVVAFATSGGSPIGKTAEKLAPHVKGTSEISAVLIHNEDELKSLL